MAKLVLTYSWDPFIFSDTVKIAAYQAGVWLLICMMPQTVDEALLLELTSKALHT